MRLEDVLDDERAGAMWAQLAAEIEGLRELTATRGSFSVDSHSPLDRDDRDSCPYQVSHAARACVTVAVDHLHAAKALVADAQVIHIGALSTLARGALEAAAAGYWILHPASRDERVTRALRWHAENARDSDRATSSRGLSRITLEAAHGKIRAVADRRELDHKAVLRRLRSTDIIEYANRECQEASLDLHLAWQVCSGFSHARPWAYLGMSNLEIAPTDDPEVAHVRLTSSLARALYPNLAAYGLTTSLITVYEQRAACPWPAT